MSLLVRDRMSSPARSVRADTPLPEVAHALEQQHVSALAVVEGEKLVGIISSTDLVRAKAHGGLAPDRLARDQMTAKVIVVAPEATLEEGVRRMVDARVHRVMVVDADGKPVGVLSTRDVLGDVVSARNTATLDSIMTRDVLTVDMGEPIVSAIEQLHEGNVHGLVVTEGYWPIGVFTHIEALAARALPPSLGEQPVESVMSHETICLDSDTPIHRAASYAISMSVRRLLVVKRRDLVGIASCLDLAATLLH